MTHTVSSDAAYPCPKPSDSKSSATTCGMP
jgi:hypothetical protein